MQSPDAVPAWTRDNSRTIKDFFTARDDSPDNGPRRASLARMPKPYSQLALLRDPRLAPHVMSPVPAWLWALEPPRILWANAAGAALLGASSGAALAERPIAPGDAYANEVQRLAASLPSSETPRLERLRGLSAGIGRRVLCACSRLSLEDGTRAILIAAAEPAGRAVPVAERVRQAFATSEAPIAVFSGDGALIHASVDAA